MLPVLPLIHARNATPARARRVGVVSRIMMAWFKTHCPRDAARPDCWASPRYEFNATPHATAGPTPWGHPADGRMTFLRLEYAAKMAEADTCRGVAHGVETKFAALLSSACPNHWATLFCCSAIRGANRSGSLVSRGHRQACHAKRRAGRNVVGRKLRTGLLIRCKEGAPHGEVSPWRRLGRGADQCMESEADEGRP